MCLQRLICSPVFSQSNRALLSVNNSISTVGGSNVNILTLNWVWECVCVVCVHVGEKIQMTLIMEMKTMMGFALTSNLIPLMVARGGIAHTNGFYQSAEKHTAWRGVLRERTYAHTKQGGARTDAHTRARETQKQTRHKIARLALLMSKMRGDGVLADPHWFNLAEGASASLGQEIKMWAAYGGGRRRLGSVAVGYTGRCGEVL